MDKDIRRRSDDIDQRAEKIVSLSPEACSRVPSADMQGVIRDLSRKTREFQARVEQLEKSQADLEKSNRKVTELLEFAPAGYVTLDGRGVVMHANISLCDMLRASKSEIVGHPFADRVKPQYWDALRSHLSDMSATGQRLTTEVEMLRRDATTFYAHLQSVPLYEESDITYRVAVMDITDRKRAERALRESEQKYRDLAELLPAIVFEVDPSGRLTFANARAMQALGLGRDDTANGLGVFELVVPEQRNLAAARFKKVLQGIDVGRNEYTLRSRDGATFPAIIHSARIETEGRVSGLRGIAVDVTERKKAEEAIRQSERRLRTTLDAALEGCIIVDFNWRYLYANDAAARQTGIPKDARLGKTVMEVLPGIEKQDVFAYLKRCLEDRVASHYETEIELPDGRKLWFEQRAEPVPEGMLLWYTDISERKATEQRLKNDLARLERIYGITQVASVMPAGMLMIEHRLIERVIALLQREQARIRQTDKLDRWFIDHVVDFFRTYADKTHHGKEEQVLFKAMLLKPLARDHKEMMEELVQEHILARQLVTDLYESKERWIAGESNAHGQLTAAIDGLVKLYPEHIEKEDKFFPRFAEYFGEQESNDMLLEFWEYDRQMVHRRYTEALETLKEMHAGTEPH